MSIELTAVLNNIIDITENLALSHTKPDDLTSQRLKNDAKKLLNINPSLTAMALGLIASIEGDIDECIKQHTLSLKLSNDPILKLNYAISMKTLGHNAESFRLIESTMGLLPDPGFAIPVYLMIAINAGKYESIQSCEDMLINKNVSIPPHVQKYFDDVNTLVARVPLPFHIYPVIASIQEAISLKNKVGLTDYALEELNGELYYWTIVKADAETISSMNIELDVALKQLENINLENLSIAFRAK